jgi:hypothetical protein
LSRPFSEKIEPYNAARRYFTNCAETVGWKFDYCCWIYSGKIPSSQHLPTISAQEKTLLHSKKSGKIVKKFHL